MKDSIEELTVLAFAQVWAEGLAEGERRADPDYTPQDNPYMTRLRELRIAVPEDVQ